MGGGGETGFKIKDFITPDGNSETCSTVNDDGSFKRTLGRPNEQVWPKGGVGEYGTAQYLCTCHLDATLFTRWEVLQVCCAPSSKKN